MLDAALARCENLQLAVRGIDELVVSLMRIFNADLPVFGAVGDKERHLDPVHMAVEVHAFGLGEKIVHIGRAEHPHYMRPIMWHRIFAFAAHPFSLDLGPIMVRTPDRPAGKARLVSDCTRHIMAAQGNTRHADPCGIDVRLRLQPIDRL